MPSPLQISILSTLFHWIRSSLLRAFFLGNNLLLGRLVESCGTSLLELLQLGFSNLNSVFNIDICVTMLIRFWHWETSRGYTHVPSLSLMAFLSSLSALILEVDTSLWWATSTKVASFKSAMSFVSLEQIWRLNAQQQRACSFSLIPTSPPGRPGLVEMIYSRIFVDKK